MYCSTHNRSDGFGAQYQNFIYAILYIENNHFIYCHNPIKQIEHNYDNKKDFIEEIEELMNLKLNYMSIPNTPVYYFRTEIYKSVENQLDDYLQSNSMKNIKNIFWKNKDKNHFKNEKMNIAVHVRRHNSHDSRIEGTNTPDKYYLNIINKIREKNVLFHIYSQGHLENFKAYENDDVVFHINENIVDTFIGLVAADALIMSMSSFSYVAALLSDGVIYYQPFWHPPAKHWIK